MINSIVRAMIVPLMGALLAAWGMLCATSLEAATTDYLVQMVCVNGSNQPIYGDPYSCASKRKLAVGEALPYHKIDGGGDQISDSFPINDLNGINRAVQTYFYKSFATDTGAFPGQTEYFEHNAGYNIIGADSSYIFFSGTWDAGGGWQPWWNSSCQARGWRLFPNQSGALSYGGASSAAGNTPKCVTSKINGAANVEWNSGTITYNSGKVIPSIYDFFFCNGTYDCLEANYFTEIYGVTRWEAWCRQGTALPGGRTCNGPDLDGQVAQSCSNAVKQATIHNNTMYMQACRDWSQIDSQPPTPWNPMGYSGSVGNVQTWAVDPLYTSTNLLTNTHFGTGAGYNSTACDITGWNRGSTTPITNWAWHGAAVAPMQGANNYNCALQFSVPSTPNGNVVYQQQSFPAGKTGTYTFGVQLWSPGTTGLVNVQIIGRDQYGNLTDNAVIQANTVDMPRTFSGSFNISSSTTTIFFAMYPQNANVPFDFSGAWIAKAP